MKKRLYLISLLVGLVISAFAQKQMQQYEYWFDDNYTAKTSNSITPASLYQLNTTIPTKNLPTGLHSFQIRFKETSGQWSATSTQFFVKIPVTSTGQNQLTQYEYWFDTNYSSKTLQAVSNQTDISLSSTISTSQLPVGLHSFQIRFKDNIGRWSSTTTQFFVKQPSSTTEENKVTKYEYWFDNNYSSKTSQTITAQSEVSLITSIATGRLPLGLHSFQMRFQSASGKWSSTTTQFFVKPNLANMGDNKIAAYEYWYNDSINKRKYVTVNPVNPLELKQILLPVNSLNNRITPANIVSVKDAYGNYQYATKNTLHIHFKDTRGAWSSVSDSTFAAILNDGNIDLSSFIINPDATNSKTGWTTSGSITNQSTGHWTGTTNPYFYFGNTGSGWTASITQTISGLPAGTYTLSAAGRATTDAKMTMTIGGVSVDFPSNGAVGGEIWNDALAGSAEKKCNNGTGFGWSKRDVTFTTDGSPVVILVSGTTTKTNQWCNIDNFTLTVNNSASLNVSLPDGVNAANYKGYALQLTNKTTGTKISVTTNGQKTYTFNGLLPSNYYKVALLTAKGSVMAGIDSIRLNRGSNSVKFNTIKNIVSVALQVLTPSKKDVTDDVSIQWYTANNQYLAQGDSLSDMTSETPIYYSVGLNKALGSQLKEPKKQAYTVTNTDNRITCTLQPLDSVTVTGIVKDENKWAISGASVAVNQQLNGKYARNLTALTDKNGNYSLTVYNDSSTVILSYPGYLSNSRSYKNFADSTNLGITLLKPITGVTVTTKFSYTPNVAEGETATTQGYYSNYQNVAYQLFNVTKNKAITEVYVQYPTLIIQDKTDVNDQIRITASSQVSEFAPAQFVITVNPNNKDTANFELKEMGAIKASYSNSYNNSNAGMLYNSQGQLIKKDSYYNATLSFSNLHDGDYTLVSMANSTFFSSVMNISELTTAGLKQGTDYTLNKVTVKSGLIATVSVSSIPALDESKFYYTGSNTTFSVNKTSVVAGNYVTLRAKLDFKSEYTGKVSNLTLIADIPNSCSFVNNSVMVGTSIAAYVRDGNRIIIPLTGNYSDQIRFCIAPSIGGTYAPNAIVKFDLNNKSVTQPIGSASFTAADMSIIVPNQTAKKTIPVSGTAAPYSTVSIYDGTTVIGQTTAFANGTWQTTCELFEAYNLTTHPISAKIQTPNGVNIQTATQKVEYNISTIEVKTVTMINTAHGAGSLTLCDYNTVFDFQHPAATMKPYWYWPSYPDFTFKIDFTNNDTAFVSNVILYVKTSSNDIVPLTASYDKVKDIWLATNKFNSNSLPVNVSVGYKANLSATIDGAEFDEYKNSAYEISSTFTSELNEINVAFKNGSDTAIQTLSEKLGVDFKKNPIDKTLKSYLDGLSDDKLKQVGDSLYAELELTLCKDTIKNEYLKNALIIQNETNFTTDDGYKIQIQKINGLTKLSIENLGFVKQIDTDGDTIYVKSEALKYSVVSFKKDIYIILTYPISNNSSVKKIQSTSDKSVSEQIKEYIKKFCDVKKLTEYIYESILDKCKEPLNELLKQETEIDKNLAKIEVCLNMSSNPVTIAKWRVIQLYFAKQKITTTIAIKAFGKLLPLIQKAIPIAKYAALIQSATDDLTTLGNIYISIPDPCPKDQVNANIYKSQAEGLIGVIGSYIIANIVADVTSSGEIIIGTVAAPESAGTSLIAVVSGVAQKTVVSLALNWVFEFAKKESMKILKENISKLHCYDCHDLGTCPCEVLGTCPPKPPGPGTPSNNPDVSHQMDPSGYVYEAVSSNRLEGVTATIYCKTVEEDMYGDKHDVITKWDAAPFLQVNPQITDANGIYAWDVPDGLWQVKYEKTGYETLYSSWLPVPPPQLDINVGMKHLVPPTVKKVRGYEEGINIQFDQYMKLATMTTSQISATRNGTTVSGTVRLLNQEEGYAADTAKYVSKVRFIPNQAFTVGDKVTVTVKSPAQSYAGLSMTSDYSQTVDIEKEVKAIAADSLAEMKIHGNRTITVSVSPAAAAKGKTITANSASASILSLANTLAVLDANGKATFNVNGDLPGGTTVQFTMPEVDDMSAVTNVNVSLTTQVAAPYASIASGTIVPKDTTVTLTCTTSGATIYYTTDGSSPSVASGTRLAYNGPIKISLGITLKAIAVKAGFDDSNVSTYSYIIALNVKISRKWDDVLVCNNTESIFSTYQWYKNDVELTGQTKQYYQEVGGLNGTYYVKVVATDGRTGTSNTVNVSIAAKSIRAYPNPAADNQSFRLEIKANESDLKLAQLSILTLSGQVVLLESNVQKQMLLTGLSKGCYIIHIRLTDGELLNEKLIVK